VWTGKTELAAQRESASGASSQWAICAELAFSCQHQFDRNELSAWRDFTRGSKSEAFRIPCGRAAKHEQIVAFGAENKLPIGTCPNTCKLSSRIACERAACWSDHVFIGAHIRGSYGQLAASRNIKFTAVNFLTRAL